MQEEIIEQSYEARLENILKVHSRRVIEDKQLSPIWKMNHLNKVGEMLRIARNNVIEEKEKE